ncbi:hypothetical protein C2845_PM02G28460 [Panicum miliaceum]|uniref:Uncharacterized protein n=1 Tax=Panicum miliaceum TaxID=4540 RepID=A0A3L6SEU3_PANMI|nr:hypothetical protein C2845_PM02G28460 [Panicum miliaceum]
MGCTGMARSAPPDPDSRRTTVPDSACLPLLLGGQAPAHLSLAAAHPVPSGRRPALASRSPWAAAAPPAPPPATAAGRQRLAAPAALRASCDHGAQGLGGRSSFGGVSGARADRERY